MPVDSQYYQAEQEPPPAVVTASRDTEGRFPKGVSGNPAGRPRGSRNQATQMAEMLLNVAAGQLTAKAIQRALRGDAVALRFCLARIIAPRRAPSVAFDLPPIDSAADLAGAMSALTAATAQGTLSPGEAGEIARVLETSLRVIEARRQEERDRRRDEQEAAVAQRAATASGAP